MTIWQRIAELLQALAQGTSDFAGSVLGLLDPDRWMPGGRDAAFTMALIALSAKMAVADGVVSAREVRAFRSMIDIPPEAERDVTRLFALAQQDMAGYDSYARKIARLFADSPATLEHVLDALFTIATADGYVHEDEYGYLRSVSDIFGFDDVKFEQVAAQHVVLPNEGPDPYAVLGLAPDASDDEVRRTYRQLVAEHHPDRMTAKGVPAELMNLASRKMATINDAYDRVSRARGHKPALVD